MYIKYNNTQLSPGQIFLMKKNKIVILLFRSTIQTKTSIKLAMLKPLTVLVFSMFQRSEMTSNNAHPYSNEVSKEVPFCSCFTSPYLTNRHAT